MKKLSVLAVTLMSLSLMQGAIAGGAKGDRLAHRMDKLQEKLSLTDTQKTAIQGILENQRAQFDNLHEAGHEQIKAQLSPEQAAQFEKLKSKRDGKRGRWAKGGKACDKS